MTTAPHVRPLTLLGRAYVAAVIVAGAVCLAVALNGPFRSQPPLNWLVLAALTWGSGWLAIKVPAIPATIYVSETFVFALVIMFGPGAAVVTVVIDGVLISLRRRDRDVGRCLFNMAEPAISVTAASAAFYWVTGITPLALSPHNAPELPVLLLPVVGMAAVYFLVNSWLTAVAVAFETRVPTFRVWRTHFMGLGLNTLGGSLLGLLLSLQADSLNIGGGGRLADPRILSGLGVVVPLLLISYLTFRTSVARVNDANRHLTEMNRLYLSTVETLATAIDAKDQVTSHHIRRVQNYALSLARAVGVHAEADLKAIEAAALLHDMGKLSVPEFILNKPGALTPTEFERIKMHAVAGAHILSQIDFPYPVVPIVRHHHEYWDGSGYPDGLRGEAIPLGARIMAVVDCYDALTSQRPYRPAMSSKEALDIIVARRGTAYDPRIVDALLDVVGDFPQLDGQARVDPAHVAPPWAATPVLSPAALERPGAGARSAEDILLLSSLAEGLAGRATLDDVAEAMSRHLRRMAPAPLVVFFLPDDHSGDIVARHVSGDAEGRVGGVRLPLGSGLSGWVAAHRRTIVNSDPALDLGDRLAALSPPLKSALSTPLVAGGELVGVLTLYAVASDAFTEDHRLLVELAARQIAPTVARAVRFDEHRATVMTDDATGLPNARSLESLIEAGGLCETASALSLGVLCFVVGRDAGSALSREDLLVSVAAATRSALRATDLVFRYSDDEFVILMPETSPATTARIAQRVATSLLDAASGAADLQVEIGIALAPRDGESIQRLLAAARSHLERQRWRDLVEAVPGAPDRSAEGGER